MSSVLVIVPRKYGSKKREVNAVATLQIQVEEANESAVVLLVPVLGVLVVVQPSEESFRFAVESLGHCWYVDWQIRAVLATYLPRRHARVRGLVHLIDAPQNLTVGGKLVHDAQRFSSADAQRSAVTPG